MPDVLIALLAVGLGLVVGPQVVLALLYGFPRAVVVTLRGRLPWSVAAGYLVTPVVWTMVLGVVALFFPDFVRQVALFGLGFGLAGLLWFRQAARADFDDHVRQALIRSTRLPRPTKGEEGRLQSEPHPRGRVARAVQRGKEVSTVEDNDVVAVRQPDGRYRISRWRQTDSALLPIHGHDGIYDEAEVYRRLDALRPTGDTYVRDVPGGMRLVQP